MIDHLMLGPSGGNSSPYVPTDPYKLKLFSTLPNFDTGAGGVEMVATGYSSGGYSVALTSAEWDAAINQGTSGARVQNNGQIATWTAGAADWEQILGLAFFDNGGTNLLWGKADDLQPTPGNGDTYRISDGALKFDLDTTTPAGISQFWKKEILDHVFAYTSRAYAAPATTYMALFTVAPDLVLGTGGTEVAAGDYARKPITMNATWDACDASGICDNTAEIAFGAATSSWGDIVAAALVSTVSGAFDLFACDSFAAVTIGNGDTFKIAAGEFNVNFPA